jgi:hypothetical protein
LLEAFRASGGTAPDAIVDRLLAERRAGCAECLARLVFADQIFGFEWRTSLWIPMFQFDTDDMSVKAGPRQVNAVLPSVWSGWRRAVWFATPDDRLDDRAPADTVGADLDAALQLARSVTPAGRLGPPKPRRVHGVPAHA